MRSPSKKPLCAQRLKFETWPLTSSTNRPPAVKLVCIYFSALRPASPKLFDGFGGSKACRWLWEGFFSFVCRVLSGLYLQAGNRLTSEIWPPSVLTPSLSNDKSWSGAITGSTRGVPLELFCHIRAGTLISTPFPTRRYPDGLQHQNQSVIRKVALNHTPVTQQRCLLAF